MFYPGSCSIRAAVFSLHGAAHSDLPGRASRPGVNTTTSCTAACSRAALRNSWFYFERTAFLKRRGERNRRLGPSEGFCLRVFKGTLHFVNECPNGVSPHHRQATDGARPSQKTDLILILEALPHVAERTKCNLRTLWPPRPKREQLMRRAREGIYTTRQLTGPHYLMGLCNHHHVSSHKRYHITTYKQVQGK